MFIELGKCLVLSTEDADQMLSATRTIFGNDWNI